MDEEILHEGSMPGAVIYISEFQNKLAWKFGISVSVSVIEKVSEGKPVCLTEKERLEEERENLLCGTALDNIQERALL